VSLQPSNELLGYFHIVRLADGTRILRVPVSIVLRNC
jgi:hypothetical protein